MKRSRSPQHTHHVLVLVCLFFIVAAFFGAVYQSFRYQELRLSVADLEKEQIQKIEANKRAIAGIAVLSAPARIDALAAQDKSLAQAFPPETIYVRMPAASDGASKEPAATPSGTATDPKRPAGSRPAP